MIKTMLKIFRKRIICFLIIMLLLICSFPIEASYFKNTQNLDSVNFKLYNELNNNILPIKVLIANFNDQSTLLKILEQSIINKNIRCSYKKYLNVYHVKNNIKFGFKRTEYQVLNSSNDLILNLQKILNNTLNINKKLNLGLFLKQYKYDSYYIQFKDTYKNNLTLTANISFLNGIKFRQYIMSGIAIPNHSINYQEKSIMSIYSNIDILKNIDKKHFNNKGIKLDIETNYSIFDNVQLSLIINNLFGEIYWKNIKYQTLNFNNKNLNNINKTTFLNPTIQGYEKIIDFKHRLPIEIYFILDNSYKKFNYKIKLPFLYNKLKKPSITLFYETKNNNDIFIGYNFDKNINKIGLSHKLFQFAFKTDNLNLNKAKSVAFTFNFVFKL